MTERFNAAEDCTDARSLTKDDDPDKTDFVYLCFPFIQIRIFERAGSIINTSNGPQIDEHNL